MGLSRGQDYTIIDIQDLSSILQPKPWIPAIPLDSLGFPGIPGYFGNSRGSFLEVGIPNNYSKRMPYGDYVIFLRSALLNISVPEQASNLFAGHSARAGGASEVAAHGLHQEDIQHLAGVTDPAWMLCYNRRYWPEQLRVSRALGL